MGFDRGSEAWRLFRILSEFAEGFETLEKIGPAVTIFGSTRMKRTSPYYKQAEALAYRLGKAGFAVITGAGPGIMEAANKGAKRAGASSVGLNIDIPLEQAHNPYVTHLLKFHYFFCRKVMFIKYTSAVIIFPGGFGTMDEFMEIVTLIQTRKAKPIPVICVGSAYWKGFLKWLQDTVHAHGAISKEDLGIFRVTDDLDEVVRILKDKKVSYSILEYSENR
jgi:uncharacterized protein (TIGR00730 family)